ncbi:unnamed protein product [Ostreobium quekettii]|uniref:Mitochondrial carrier protein n=1 Tax=Ostreobium quekettii TaxID=121088 RepID=A0A8S1INU4_9CHLO|nr:unnamed protein product [Ostreobium quekettii]|eukprot:evm.model.scf_3563.1 EVM.evm.TU.scf_3563.1   scf_3563:2394-5308(-)
MEPFLRDAGLQPSLGPAAMVGGAWRGLAPGFEAAARNGGITPPPSASLSSALCLGAPLASRCHPASRPITRIPDRAPRPGLLHPARLPGGNDIGLRQDLFPPIAYSPTEGQPLSQILSNAGKKALGGGVPGMVAMFIQVGSLMWLRTTVNYQYRNGTSTTEALRTLYKEGGIRRFYRGVGPALIQGPLSRFGDTAANTGVLALMDSSASTRDLPVWAKTGAASVTAGLWRIFLMPVDACKTMLQVEGAKGLKVLGSKVTKGGPTVLYHGALAASAATMVGHYPWFATYNYLNYYIPQYDELHKRLLRSAFIGFCASFVSDSCSNSIRVIKTSRQTATEPMTYPQVVRGILAKEGIYGLMFRGLKTKILTNGLQGILFSVLWRLGMDYWEKSEKAKKAQQ